MKLLRRYIRGILSETFQSHTFEPVVGDIIINVNPECKHKGSIGEVIELGSLDDDAGITASYECLNDGPTWESGDVLEKTLDQLAPYDETVGES